MSKLLDLTTPMVMGILNVTPDSFYDGNRYTQEKSVLKRVETMLEEGAAIIDIGAFSSRPGASFVSLEEERQRLIPFLKSIIKHFPVCKISIDTFRHQIAEESVAEGAFMINDISAGHLDKKMFDTIANLQVPYVMMHMKGTPENMQNNPVYQDVVAEIIDFFKEKIAVLQQKGFHQIIIDPGFGFGKSLQHNYQILQSLQSLKVLGYPVLAGLSRKSMLFKLLDATPQDMGNATTVVNTIALLNGAGILRVHDVKPAVEAVKIVNYLGLAEKR